MHIKKVKKINHKKYKKVNLYSNKKGDVFKM